MRPRLPAILSAPGELGHRFALDCSRRNFGLRTLLAVSSVASGRIEFVSRPLSGHYSTDYPFTSSCSPPRVATTQLLSVTGGKLRQRGTLTLLCTLTLKRTSRNLQLAQARARHKPDNRILLCPFRSVPSRPYLLQTYETESSSLSFRRECGGAFRG